MLNEDKIIGCDPKTETSPRGAMNPWSLDLMKKLIEAYRDEPILWDMNLKKYRNVNHFVRGQAWDRLAARMKISRTECERKMNSLLAQYRRERIRMARARAGVAREKSRQWFGYKWFDFLARMDETRGLDFRGLKPVSKRNKKSFEQLDANYADEIDYDDNGKIDKNQEEIENNHDENLKYLKGDVGTVAGTIKEPGIYRVASIKGQNVFRSLKKLTKKPINKRVHQPNPTLARVDSGFQCPVKTSSKRSDSKKAFCEHLSSVLRRMPEENRKDLKFKINTFLYKAELEAQDKIKNK